MGVEPLIRGKVDMASFLAGFAAVQVHETKPECQEAATTWPQWRTVAHAHWHHIWSPPSRLVSCDYSLYTALIRSLPGPVLKSSGHSTHSSWSKSLVLCTLYIPFMYKNIKINMSCYCDTPVVIHWSTDCDGDTQNDKEWIAQVKTTTTLLAIQVFTWHIEVVHWFQTCMLVRWCIDRERITNGGKCTNQSTSVHYTKDCLCDGRVLAGHSKCTTWKTCRKKRELCTLV